MRLNLFAGCVCLVGSVLAALGGCARESARATTPSVTTTSSNGAREPGGSDAARVPERPSNEAVKAELEAAQRAKAADAGANAKGSADANGNANANADADANANANASVGADGGGGEARPAFDR